MILSEKGEIAYQAIKNLIISKKWIPGQRHSILEVSKVLKISRTPVSEAVKLLASEGYIRIYPQKGFEVKTYSANEIEEILEIKTVLEELAISKTVSNITSKDIDKLREILDKHEKCIKINDLEKASSYDEEFHFILFKSANSPHLEGIITSLWYHGQWYSNSFSDVDESMRKIEEHKQLLDAIISKDCEKAKIISRNHNNRFRKKILTNLDLINNIGYKDIKDDISKGEFLLSHIGLIK